LGGAKKISLAEFPDQVPIDEPRFHFYNWNHQHDGATLDSLVYIYSSPDGSEGTKSAPVKLRMLYSSSKANVTNIAQSVNLEIATRFEVNRGSEINESSLRNQIHPPPVQVNKGFAKPKGPGKGPARLVKGN
jgi:twinfilin-like protein